MYKDIEFDLKKTKYKDFNVLENENCIKQSLRNILLTNKGELHYFPQFGCNIKKYLFEKLNTFTILAIKNEITFAIKNFEPRVRLTSIEVYEDNFNQNSIIIDITYYVDVLKKEVSQQLTLRLL